MAKVRKTVRTKKGVKPYTFLGCPLTRNRSAWCHRLCAPDKDGHGRCGRIAPHGLRGRTDLAIFRHKKRMLAAQWEKLESSYVSAPCNRHFDPGVSISRGAAEIVLPVAKKLQDATGALDGSVLCKAMGDAALLAVGSLTGDDPVRMVGLKVSCGPSVRTETVAAHGRVLGTSGKHYLAEAVALDAEGNEIGRATGEFATEQALDTAGVDSE